MKRFFSFFMISFLCAQITVVHAADETKKSLLERSAQGTLQNNISQIANAASVALNSFFLVLFLLDRNVLRIERYDLNTLNDELNIISRKKSNENCDFALKLGERGQSVVDIKFNPADVTELFVLSKRGKKEIPYLLDWAALIVRDDVLVDEAVRAQAQIIPNKSLSPLTHFKNKAQTKIEIEWAQKRLLIQLQEPFQQVAAVVVPQDLFKNTVARSRIVLAKELFESGIMQKSLARGGAIDDENDDEGAVDQEEQSPAHGNKSAVGSFVQSMAARLVAFKEFVAQKLGLA